MTERANGAAALDVLSDADYPHLLTPSEEGSWEFVSSYEEWSQRSDVFAACAACDTVNVTMASAAITGAYLRNGTCNGRPKYSCVDCPGSGGGAPQLMYYYGFVENDDDPDFTYYIDYFTYTYIGPIDHADYMYEYWLITESACGDTSAVLASAQAYMRPRSPALVEESIEYGTELPPPPSGLCHDDVVDCYYDPDWYESVGGIPRELTYDEDSDSFQKNDAIDVACGAGPTPTPVPTAVPSPAPIPAPTTLPIPLPSALPIPVPSALPIPEPSALPIPVPSALPIPVPSALPIPVPSALPIPEPSGAADSGAVGAADPGAVGAATGAVGAADPGAVGAADSGAVGAADPGAVGAADSGAVGAADPGAVGAADSGAVGAADPGAVGAAEPLADGHPGNRPRCRCRRRRRCRRRPIRHGADDASAERAADAASDGAADARPRRRRARCRRRHRAPA